MYSYIVQSNHGGTYLIGYGRNKKPLDYWSDLWCGREEGAILLRLLSSSEAISLSQMFIPIKTLLLTNKLWFIIIIVIHSWNKHAQARIYVLLLIIISVTC